MNLSRALTVLVLCVACLAPSALHAQQPDSSSAARFHLAERYMQAGNVERAIPLFEDLYAAAPNTYVFYERLRQAYEGQKRYADAVRLVEAQARRQPQNPVFASEKARLLYLSGDEAAAAAAWEAALARDPDNRQMYRIVFKSMNEVRLVDRAIAVLEKGRDRIGPDAGFQAELAYLYTQAGRHEEAFEQYLILLEQNERQVNLVRSRLARFAEDPASLSAGIAATERAVRRAPLNRAFRELLAWLYLEAGDYRKALDANRAIDRLEQEDGRVLFAFAQAAADAEAYDAAGDAYAEILARYPDAPSAPEAQLGMAAMFEQWARKTGETAFDTAGQRVPAPNYDRALAGYGAFLEKYPGHPYYPEVLRRVGVLQQDVYFELIPAEQTFLEVLRRYPNDEAADAAEFDLGRLALLRGDLDPAKMAFSRLVDRLGIGDLAERARYELALIHFYQGDFEAAQTLVEAINQNTSSLVANDAIELKVLLLENKGPDSLSTPLRSFAQAHLLQRQQRAKDALSLAEELLAKFPSHPLADDARFLRARALRAAGRAEEAAAAFTEIPLMFPTSFLADRSLFSAAETLERDLGDTARALELYGKLLADYPGSLYAAEARHRIRTLRGDGV